jgi:starvation-inducible outer membrane lipoprotein
MRPTAVRLHLLLLALLLLLLIACIDVPVLAIANHLIHKALESYSHDLLSPTPQGVCNSVRLDGMVPFVIQQGLAVCCAAG